MASTFLPSGHSNGIHVHVFSDGLTENEIRGGNSFKDEFFAIPSNHDINGKIGSDDQHEDNFAVDDIF